MFGTVEEAMKETGADVSVVFVPPAFAKAAVVEAIDAAIGLAVVITEGIPVHDSAEFWAHAVANGNRTRIIGPNCPGIISPGKSNAGIIPADIAGRGADRVGVEVGHADLPDDVRAAGHRVLHGDRHRRGPDHRDHAHRRARRRSRRTRRPTAIVMIGEIGGDAEERAADFVKANVTKPVVGYVAGFTAPEGKTMGHAGAIVSGSAGTAQAKKDALEAAGVRVGKTPSETAALMREIVASL